MLVKVKLPAPPNVRLLAGAPEMTPVTERLLAVLFVQVCAAPSATGAEITLSAATLEALSVMPPAPSVSVFAPPMTTAPVSSGVKVRLLIEKACPSTVFKLAAPNRLKNTSSELPGRPAVELLKSADDDQLVPAGPPVVFQAAS